MRFPLGSTVQIRRYVARQQRNAIHSGFEPSAAYEAASSLKESARSMAWTPTG